jgi:hypothetical protein
MATSSRSNPDVPHSWDRKSWPKEVWPGDQKRAGWVLRAYRNELIAEGALTRAGKTLIVLGRGYSKWLAKRAAHVADFESNNPNLHQQNAA